MRNLKIALLSATMFGLPATSALALGPNYTDCIERARAAHESEMVRCTQMYPGFGSSLTQGYNTAMHVICMTDAENKFVIARNECANGHDALNPNELGTFGIYDPNNCANIDCEHGPHTIETPTPHIYSPVPPPVPVSPLLPPLMPSAPAAMVPTYPGMATPGASMP